MLSSVRGGDEPPQEWQRLVCSISYVSFATIFKVGRGKLISKNKNGGAQKQQCSKKDGGERERGREKESERMVAVCERFDFVGGRKKYERMGERMSADK
jgi:hypothetical protein